ncbi:ABC transporter permease [Fusobacterium sp. PH5-44]|uniref:ABC transporter permease n=1 Tax=unclassified Fusobacterium TaxID=2648384 RepID=UPI003D2013B8
MKLKQKILLVLLILVIIISIFFYNNPYSMHDGMKLATPTFSNILGCDSLGRDVFSRLLLGGFYSILISFSAVLLSSVGGVLIGSVAGYYGKWPDFLINQLAEVLIAVPSILIALGVVVILGTGFFSLIIAIFLMYLPRSINLVRGLVKKEKYMEYIIAVKTYGVSDIRVLFVHIFPNIKKDILINFNTSFAGAILTEAGLGYLGLGIQPPIPTLGNMLSQSLSYFLSAPWITIPPGLAIIFIVYFMNKIGKRTKRY